GDPMTSENTVHDLSVHHLFNPDGDGEYFGCNQECPAFGVAEPTDNGTLAGWDDELQDWADADPRTPTHTNTNDVYQRAARAGFDAVTEIAGGGDVTDAEVDDVANEPGHRAAVDVARADLLTEIETLRGGYWREREAVSRLTRERDVARADGERT